MSESKALITQIFLQIYTVAHMRRCCLNTYYMIMNGKTGRLYIYLDLYFNSIKRKRKFGKTDLAGEKRVNDNKFKIATKQRKSNI